MTQKWRDAAKRLQTSATPGVIGPRFVFKSSSNTPFVTFMTSIDGEDTMQLLSAVMQHVPLGQSAVVNSRATEIVLSWTGFRALTGTIGNDGVEPVTQAVELGLDEALQRLKSFPMRGNFPSDETFENHLIQKLSRRLDHLATHLP